MKSVRSVAHIVGAVVLLIAYNAAAAELDPALKACAGLRNDAERLACYDRAVAQLYSGNTGELARSVASAEAMFGMGGQVRSKQPAQVPDREEIASISAKVKGLREAADGSLLIELDNGQIWRQVDSKKLLLEVGDSVTVSRAALTSFRIAAPNNRFGRVRRVQ